MQSREIDLGVICILVREEALQTDELSEKTGGEGKEEDPYKIRLIFSVYHKGQVYRLSEILTVLNNLLDTLNHFTVLESLL